MEEQISSLLPEWNLRPLVDPLQAMRGIALINAVVNANFSPETLGGGMVRMTMIVEDPNAVFDRAVKAGAKIV